MSFYSEFTEMAEAKQTADASFLLERRVKEQQILQPRPKHPQKSIKLLPYSKQNMRRSLKKQNNKVFQTKQQDDGRSSELFTAKLSVMNKSSVNCGLQNLWSHRNCLGWLLPAWRRGRNSISRQCGSVGWYKNTTFEPGSDQRIQLINSGFGYEKNWACWAN